MSPISSDAGFSAARLDRLDGPIALDDLRRQAADGQAPVADPVFDSAPRGPQADPGEDILTIAAWDGVPAGARQLPGEPAFEHRLAALDLSMAADQGADAILDALG